MPIVQRILDALAPLAFEAVALTNDASLATVRGLRLAPDPEPHAGVLPALANGLEAARGDVCLAVACDMPFVSRQLFQFLVAALLRDGADVAIVRSEGYLEPMHAAYRRAAVLQAVRAALARGEQRMISYLGDVVVREVSWAEALAAGADEHTFFNVNTPMDLARARGLAGGT